MEKGFFWKLVLCEDGLAAINEIVEIGREKYYLDYNGQMETGKINIYDSESGDYNYYVTDSNGAFIKDNWVRTDLEWYYAGKVISEPVGKGLLFHG